ncbi:uncharacterized protein LOC132758528 [Ruditapes philippinarum]|uniref:uncharacterized protein LOC132758528 n=1 Tax=Ruditapes philippinarum TaxID=129788 RepID=UPI00295A87B4|nr:uncharacterized protein LOC132758528 [Ruditapes philippinarum]
MIKLLKGTTVFKYDQGAQQAVAKLEQIQSDTLIVNTQTLTEVLSDLILLITKEDENMTRQRGKSKMSSLQKNTTISTLRLNVLCGFRDVFSRDHRNIKIRWLESIISHQRETICELKEIVKKSQTSEDKGNGIAQHKRTKRETTMQPSFSEKSYDQLKSELKHDLVQLYFKRHNTIPLSPLMQDNNASLLDFYVQPAMKVVDLNKGLFDRKEHLMYQDVGGLEDIFQKKNDKICRNIVLTASPGAGKTTFIKHLVLTWCQTQTKDHNHLLKDQKHMQQFDFVFIFSLRDARNECEQDAMIKRIVISQLNREYCYEFLQEILNKEHCLVLMDDLDEWQHPNSSIRACHFGKSDFPHIKDRPKCINLTTSRPWTLNNIRNYSNLIDKRIEVQGLGKESSKQLVGKVLSHLTFSEKLPSQIEQEKQKHFFKMLSSKRLRNFESTPVILMHLLCLWLEETDPGESRCEIYSNMLELLFRRAEITKSYRKKGKQQMKLPNCFTRNTLCKRNAKLLLSLGNLAFATLFGTNGEAVYVFDRFIANGLMQDHDVQRCLEVGILSQNETIGNKTDSIQLSFLHKTFQEFFAALMIADKPEMAREVAIRIPSETFDKYLQLEFLLVFLSGFAPEIASELTTRIGKEIANDAATKEFRETTGTVFLESRLPMNDYCNMISNCVMESISSGHSLFGTFYIEDIFIDDQCMDMKYANALRSVIEMNSKHIKSLSIHVIQTVHEDIPDCILHELNTQEVCNLQKICVRGNIPRVHLQSLLQISRHSAKCLELRGMQQFSEDIVIISAMKNIESLSFLSISMTHSVFEKFMAHFSQRKQLSQLCLNDIKCVDHPKDCPGFSLNISNESNLVWLLLDKVNLTHIRLNAGRLKICAVEWLAIPGFLKSLLDCLSHSENLESFDYDGSACQEDTEALVYTISSMQGLRYLRLRNIDLKKFHLHLDRLHTLKTVYFSNVSIETVFLQKVTEHFRSLKSSVMFCMDNCDVSPQETYQQIKQRLRLSKEIEILLDEELDFKQLHIKSIPSDKTLNTAQESGT